MFAVLRVLWVEVVQSQVKSYKLKPQPPEMRTPLYTVELLYSNPLK